MPRQGNRAQRGYGYWHKKLRAQLLPESYGKICDVCGHVMLPGQDLDLGHTDDRTGYVGMQHSSCNRTLGARKGNRTRSNVRRRTRDRSATIDVPVDDI